MRRDVETAVLEVFGLTGADKLLMPIVPRLVAKYAAQFVARLNAGADFGFYVEWAWLSAASSRRS
jgi:hypothetical protein